MGRVWPDVLRFYQIQSETAKVAVGASPPTTQAINRDPDHARGALVKA
jgi:hypothetical protein